MKGVALDLQKSSLIIMATSAGKANVATFQGLA